MRDEADKVLEKYLTLENLNKMKYLYDHRDEYIKRDGRGGFSFHRGFYSHEILKDIHVSNIHRGKVLKRPSIKAPDFHYYYDESERMFLCVKNPYHLAELTWVQRTETGDFSISVPLSEDIDCVEIAETIYNHDKIVKYMQFEYELSDETNTLDKLMAYLKRKDMSLHTEISLNAFYLEELFYQDNKLYKGISKYNETAYNLDSRTEEYEFHFQYVNGRLLKERSIVELNNPFINQPSIQELFETLPCEEYLSKADIELIEAVNEGKL